MRKTFIPLISVVGAASLGLFPILTSAQSQEPAKPKISFEKEIVPIVKASCLGCHNKDNAKHNVMFPDKMTLEDALKNPKLWRKSGREVKNKIMPPKDNATLSDKDRAKFVAWVEATFPKTNPGSTPPSPPPIPPTTGGGTGH